MRHSILSSAILATGLATATLATAPAADGPALTDLVVLTEDNATNRFLDDPLDGCDAVSVASLYEMPEPPPGTPLPTLRPEWAGSQTISPGRLTASQDFSMVVAGYTNHRSALRHTTSSTFVVRAVRDDDDPTAWTALPPLWIDQKASGTIREDTFPGASGIAVLDDDDTLLVTRFARWTTGSWRRFGPFVLEAYRMSAATNRSSLEGEYHVVAPPLRSTEIDGNAFAILPDHLSGVVHVLSEAGTLYSFHAVTFSEVAPPVRFQPPLAEDDTFRANLHLSHATWSPDRRMVFSNRWDAGAIVVSDLVDRTSWTLDLTSTHRTAGLAVSHGPQHANLLAVHEWDSVAVYDSPAGDWRGLREVARTDTKFSHGIVDYPVEGGLGPIASLSWSGDGRYLIVAEPEDTAEFVVFSLDTEAGVLERIARIEVCRAGINYPNDVLTANGYFPTPIVTASSTPSPTHTAVPTRIATATITATHESVATATSTSTPSPVYLPLALVETCDPRQVRIDAALVIDASSSMNEPAAPGSAQTKLDAALKAVGSFLDILELGRGDQAAIVSFNSDAWLHTGLTAERATLNDALSSVEPGRQTRLDRGLEVGTAALLDSASRDLHNEPVLIVLTDGRANPVPVDVAVALADHAKSEGTTIFTIGLGEDLEDDALRQIASEPGFYLHAPTPGELADAYAEVARSIPCPASAYWGKR